MPRLILLLILFSHNWTYCQKNYTLNKINESEIKIDGFISEKEKVNSIKTNIDYEWEPGYNTPSQFETSVYISYTDTNLYVGVIAYGDPNNIRGQLRPRDQMEVDLNEDIIFLRFDPYKDARSVFLLASNAYGSQIDLRARNAISDEERYDMTFNAIYETKSSINEQGYIIEFLIPFNSIPYPKGKDQEWGFNMMRFMTIDGTRVANISDKYDRDNPCRICQISGRLIMKNIEYKRKTELLPYISGNLSGNRGSSSSNSISYGKTSNEIGLGLKYDLSPSSSIELTINPDFSQVEADETQIDINSAYALQYPELRPYFSKGMDLLSFLDNAFYSRTINSPSISSKVTSAGKSSRSIILTAVDQNSPYLIGGEDKSYFGEGEVSYTNAFRHQKIINDGAKYGFFTTNRYYEGGGYGNLFGFDGLFTFKKIWRVQFEIIKNFNEEPIANWIDSDDMFSNKTVKLDGEKFNGSANYIRISRQTENWNSYFFYRAISANFRADLGFVPKNNRKWMTFYQGYDKILNKKYLKRFTFSLKGDLTHNFKNELKSRNLDIDFSITTIGRTQINYNYDINFIRNYLGVDYKNVGKSELMIMGAPINDLTFVTTATFGKEIAYNEDLPEIGKEKSFFMSVNYKIGNNISLSPSIRYSSLKKLDKTKSFYDGYISRVSSRYQFNNDLSLRVISEYNNFNDTFYVQPLLQWNPNPSTIFYIGGNQSSINDFSQDPEDFDPFRINTSQFFIKFQYLIGV